jgi:hypothetical protein
MDIAAGDGERETGGEQAGLQRVHGVAFHRG